MKRHDRERLAQVSRRQMAKHTGTVLPPDPVHPAISEQQRSRSLAQFNETRRLLEARGAKIQHDTAAIGGERDQKPEGGHGD